MKINELFNKKTVFSFEVFPPKKDSPVDTIYKTLDALSGLAPDFISVTYGAGGDGGNDTVKIASAIKNTYKNESVAHLPCINLTKENVTEILQTLKDNNVDNILALRGDKNPAVERKTDFLYASDLISFIKRSGNFNIIGACYPEVHAEASDMETDISNLRKKVDAGADHLITQLFFDNDIFYSFLEKIRAAGIHVPVQAGIMPLTSKKQVERIVSMCGAAMPEKLKKTIAKYENDLDGFRKAGIEYAVEQIAALVGQQVDGIHLYTMNNPGTASKITSEVLDLPGI